MSPAGSQSPVSLQRTPTGDGAVLAARGGRVKKEYASVAELPAALLGCHFEHHARVFSCCQDVWTIEFHCVVMVSPQLA